MLRKIHRYYSTLRYLQFRQIFYQIYYRFKKLFRSGVVRNYEVPPSFTPILQPSIPAPRSWFNGYFRFLNLEQPFQRGIIWDFKGYGKLWTYNLNYFDFLNQKEITTQEAIMIIDDFCADPDNRKASREPYPISLRGINWIKFFSYHGVKDPKYDRVLFADYQHLRSNPEYHLMGNHLLENGFSLLFAAYYFRSEKFYRTASGILRPQMKEQILQDGGHFELSPMYHQIILMRTLDAINLLQHNLWKEDDLLSLLIAKAKAMAGWLQAITFRCGAVPMVNDSAFGIAPTSRDLTRYAGQLGVPAEDTILSDSGYRLIRTGEFELLVDVGNIGPDYIPGHAHSDTLNFVLQVSDRPTIVDTGVSTYEVGKKRMTERSTTSHNTVLLNGEDQSEVWSSFRVGRRAKVIECIASANAITAEHNGYKRIGAIHRRTWQWTSQTITILDEIRGTFKGEAIALLHFHPDLAVKIDQQTISAGPLNIEVSDYLALNLSEYHYALGFNDTATAQVVQIKFSRRLRITLALKATAAPKSHPAQDLNDPASSLPIP